MSTGDGSIRAALTALGPPAHLVELAVEVSTSSPCRSKRGSVIFRGDDMVAHGHNFKPNGFECDGSAECKATCRTEAIHAEQQALLTAGNRARGAEMLHVKSVGGKLVPSGGPSCVQCSKLGLAAGVTAMWLYHEDGWRRYETAEWHRLSLSALLARLEPPPSAEPITVVVNGQPVKASPGSVRGVIAQAITLSGQIGAPLAQWELRTPDGEVIPHHLSDGGEWMLGGGTLLFLNLGLPPAARLEPPPPPVCPFCQQPLQYTGWADVEKNSRWSCHACSKRVEITPFLPSEERKALVPSLPEVDSAQRVVKSEPPPQGWDKGVLYCYGGCGTRYSDFPRDMSLPTPLWNRIAVGAPFDETQENIDREGRGGVLCPTCIVKRLAALPECAVVFADIDLPLHLSEPPPQDELTGREHELKCWPEFFEEIVSGRKRFEIRENDRDFQVGDVLWLREYAVGVGFSGRSARFYVSYMTDWKQQDRYVVMGLTEAPASPQPPEKAQEPIDLMEALRKALPKPAPGEEP